jgi:hypothetical protein
MHCSGNLEGRIVVSEAIQSFSPLHVDVLMQNLPVFFLRAQIKNHT